METEFILIKYPHCEILYDQNWLDRCILLDSEDQIDKYGFPAFLAPKQELINLFEKNGFKLEIFKSKQG